MKRVEHAKALERNDLATKTDDLKILMFSNACNSKLEFCVLQEGIHGSTSKTSASVVVFNQTFFTPLQSSSSFSREEQVSDSASASAPACCHLVSAQDGRRQV